MFMSSTDNVFENEGTAGVSYLGTVIAIIEQLANSNQLNKVLQSIYGSGDATAALIQWATPVCCELWITSYELRLLMFIVERFTKVCCYCTKNRICHSPVCFSA